MGIEHYKSQPSCSTLPGSEQITSLPCSWGLRKRDITPQRVIGTLVEKANFDHEQKKKAVSCSLYEARIIYLREVMEEEVAEFTLQLPQSPRTKLLIPTSCTNVVDTAFGVAQRGSIPTASQ